MAAIKNEGVRTGRARSGLRLVNGRVVGKALTDPDVRVEVEKLQKDMRKSVDGLISFYVEQGILTPTGKLTKRFGG